MIWEKRNSKNLSLARNGCHTAHLPTFERIDHATLPYVRISDESYRDLLLVRVQLRELAEQLYEGAFPEGVVR